MNCRKQEAICFAMRIISGKPKSLSNADRHTGNVKPYTILWKRKIGENNFGKVLTICWIHQRFLLVTFTVRYLSSRYGYVE